MVAPMLEVMYQVGYEGRIGNSFNIYRIVEIRAGGRNLKKAVLVREANAH